MMIKEFHYRWEWTLKSPPEALWHLVSDTNRFNRDTGLPSVEYRADDGSQPTVNARRRLKLFRLGVPVEWEEEPFEWVRPYRFGVVRRYSKGPVREMRVSTELTPALNGGTQLQYEVWATPANAIGFLAIPIQIGLLSARSFDQAFRKYDRLAEVHPTPGFVAPPANPNFVPGGRERLMELTQALSGRGVSASLANRLADIIATADDLTAARMRPYAIADYWGAPRRDVLEMFLWATRLGLLEFRWEVLCPMCRGPQESGVSMSDILPQVHCRSCNIDFEANFERSVELIFAPSGAVRRREVGEFCVGGPQLTPHIVAQQLLGAGEQRTLTLPLESGRYRVRAMQLAGGQYFTSGAAGATHAEFVARTEGWLSAELAVGSQPSLALTNATPHEQLLIIERMAWSDQAVTAAEVTALQLFRDLFAREALRPGTSFSVGSVAILFTDLRDSTRMYRQVGDAVAFGRVLNHFDILRNAISDEQGALVKTIGDSVMAVFTQPVNAIRAILKAQHQLAHPPEGMLPLDLKAGLHYGACIAVTLNERLDYFGSTVNIAARLEGLAAGGGIVVSNVVRHDTEVESYLSQVGEGVIVEPFEARLRGFDDEQFKLWRLQMK